MTLSEWIKDNATSQVAFATFAGIDNGSLSRYLALERGEASGHVPSPKSRARIEKATKGAVPSGHWDKLKVKTGAIRFRRNGAKMSDGKLMEMVVRAPVGAQASEVLEVVQVIASAPTSDASRIFAIQQVLNLYRARGKRDARDPRT